jgi:hypothetical protein
VAVGDLTPDLQEAFDLPPGTKGALVQQVVAMGARFVTAGVDWDLMMAGVRQRVGSLRALTV